MSRQAYAERIVAGLSGWLQQLAAQDLEKQVGEDAARVELVRNISAQRSYIPETSQRPTNWPETTKKRIDIALLGRSAGAAGWYGAIELKWPKENIDVAQCRQNIVEDAVRAAFCDTTNLNAHFMIVGGTTEALRLLFDNPHTAQLKERQRRHFGTLFPRNPGNPDGTLTNAEMNTHFPDFGDRIPQTVFDGWTRRFATTLLATSSAYVGSEEKGAVFVWQCKK